MSDCPSPNDPLEGLRPHRWRATGAHFEDLLRAVALAEQKPAEFRLQMGVLGWIDDAVTPGTSATLQALSDTVLGAAAQRLLAARLAAQGEPVLRLLALNCLERLTRVKAHRPAFYSLIPAVARLAVDPVNAARGPTHGMLGSTHQQRQRQRRSRGPDRKQQRDLYEMALSLLNSFIQHPRLGPGLGPLLAQPAAQLVLSGGDFSRNPVDDASFRRALSVYRGLKVVMNLSNPDLGCQGQMPVLVSAGVVERCQQLARCGAPLLREEARLCLLNLSGAAPQAFLGLGQQEAQRAQQVQQAQHGHTASGSTSSSGGSSGRSSAGGSSATAEQARALVKAQLAKLDASSPAFDIEELVIAANVLQNLVSASPETYSLAMLNAGVPAVLIAACDKVADSPELEEFRGRSENHRIASDVANVCIGTAARILVFALGEMGIDIKHDPLTRELRRQLIPRLRKYLLHPLKDVRAMVFAACCMLGCLDPERHAALPGYPPESIQARLVARMLDVEGRFALSMESIATLPSDSPVDLRFPPMVRFDELKMCDCCGRHNHFLAATGRPRLSLRLCSGCRERRYCTPTCQKLHWKVHKPVCRAIAASKAADEAAAPADGQRQRCA
ncbi:hypothetical protein ABPG75_011890 [Micractinium tetrahymenae]